MKNTWFLQIVVLFVLTSAPSARAAEVHLVCPVNVPSSQLVPGDSIRVQVLFDCSIPVGAFSLGFEVDNPYLEITSVDTAGTVVPPGSSDYLFFYHPAPNKCLVGWLLGVYSSEILPQPGLRLLFSLNFRMLPGIRPGTANIQSAFIPPAGPFVFTAFPGCYDIEPLYYDCGTADIVLGGVTITSDPSFNLCPGADAPFRVKIIDELGEPVVGDNGFSVNFQSCGSVRSCTAPGLPGTIYPLAPTNEQGVVTFYASGLQCVQACRAIVMHDGNQVADVPVRSFDVDGDSTVRLDDWDTTSVCVDFTGNGAIDHNDIDLFEQHRGHGCQPDPCELFGYNFILNPSENLDSGAVVNLSLSLSNNNMAQSCYIGVISYYMGAFGTDATDSLLGWIYYNSNLSPGQQDTTEEFQYRIPGWGPRCLKARFTTPCCASTVQLIRCIDVKRPCDPDSSLCYHFSIDLARATKKCYRYPDLPVNWRIEDLPPGSFPYNGTPGPATIDYLICTAAGASLGDTGSVMIYVEEYSGLVWPFVNRVVITSNTGDANADCFVDISDAVYLIAYIFSGGAEPKPYAAGDPNCDGFVDISDVVYLITYIFSTGVPPCIVEP